MKTVVIVTGQKTDGKAEYINSALPGCYHFCGEQFFDAGRDSKRLRRAYMDEHSLSLVVDYAVLSWDECEAILECLGVQKVRHIETVQRGNLLGAKESTLFLTKGGGNRKG